MRAPAALSAALAGLLLASVASAQSSESGAAPEPGAVPAPAASAASASVASASVAPASVAPASVAPASVAPASVAPALATPALIVVPAEPDQPALEAIPNAKDTLGGHFVIGASLGAKWPSGSLESERRQSSYLGAGLGLNLDLGVGLGRNLVLGVWGEFDAHRGESSSCTACSGASSLAAGPFLRYHLVQGTRFDPWGQLAVGVRNTHTDPPASETSSNYFGPELLKLSLGGDWYPTSHVGIGPYVTFDMGTFASTVHSGLGTGLRLVLDLPGK